MVDIRPRVLRNPLSIKSNAGKIGVKSLGVVGWVVLSRIGIRLKESKSELYYQTGRCIVICADYQQQEPKGKDDRGTVGRRLLLDI